MPRRPRSSSSPWASSTASISGRWWGRRNRERWRPVGPGEQCQSGDVAAAHRPADRIRRGVASDAHDLAHHFLRRHPGPLLIASGELPRRASACKPGWNWPNGPDALLRRRAVRLRAHTTDDTDTRRKDLRAALDWPGVRMRRYSNYVLRQIFSSFMANRRGKHCRTPSAGFPTAAVGRKSRAPGTARVSRPGGRVAILGGGMAGLSAAWRLSEPGWRDRFESITVYQRGWRLGGKAASSRGPTGGSRNTDCTSGWDHTRTRSRSFASATPNWTGPQQIPRRRSKPGNRRCPADNLGLADRGMTTGWRGRALTRATTSCPANPDSTGREMTAVGFVAARTATGTRLRRLAARCAAGGSGAQSDVADPPPSRRRLPSTRQCGPRWRAAGARRDRSPQSAGYRACSSTRPRDTRRARR